MSHDEIELQSKLLVVFKEEAKDHLKVLSESLFKLEKRPAPPIEAELTQAIFRSVHSLKGAARAVNFLEIEKMCASLEDVLDCLRKKTLTPTPPFFETLFQSTEVLEKMISGEEAEPTAIYRGSCGELVEKLEHLIEEKASATEKGESPKAPEKPVEAPVVESPSSSKVALQSPPPEVKPTKEVKPVHKEKLNHTSHITLKDSIRISSAKVDRLLQHVEEMLMIKLSSKEKIRQVEHISFLLEEWGKRTQQNDLTKMRLNLFPTKHYKNELNLQYNDRLNEMSTQFERNEEFFKKLLDKVSELKRLVEQDYRMICGLVDNVIDDTKEILMQPFSTLLEGFPKMARELAATLGKQVQLELSGDEIEVDRRILEKLKDPLIHILRNSFDHGIELSEKRVEAGKDPKGRVTISTTQMSGNTFEVRFTDDGQGIDFEKVKKKGIEQGAISVHERDSITKEQLIALLFSPGFSTSQIVTDISGRGIGLNVLAENVEKLGGAIRVESTFGKGTEFIITMPLTLATFRGIHVKVSDQEFIVPTHHVVRVFRGSEVKTAEGRKIINFEGETYSYAELSEVLGIPVKNSPEDHQDFTQGMKPRLLIKAQETLIAFGVDSIHNEQEVFVKGLGKQLQRVKNIAGATITEWGRVIPILDPFDLVKSACAASYSSVRYSTDDAQSKVAQKAILVIEDSITSRMLLKNILESAGYKVKTSVDGYEGYNTLLREPFDLILSDVDMPRINGFELTKKIRKTEKFKNLPVVLCTSRGSKEDRQQGIECGANAYLDKSNFMQKNLLEIIEQLL